MTQKTIIIKGGQGMQKEFPLKASSDITPGMLIQRDAGYYKPNAIAPDDTGATIYPSKIFALESPYSQVAVGAKAIDTQYDTDKETVIGYYALPGDEIYAWLAAGENVAADAVLESNGAGALQAYTTAGGAVCRATEAVDNSATGAVAVRIKVEVL